MHGHPLAYAETIHSAYYTANGGFGQPFFIRIFAGATKLTGFCQLGRMYGEPDARG
jgi:hypothetical protein